MKILLYGPKLSSILLIIISLFMLNPVVPAQGTLTTISFFSNSLDTNRYAQIYLPEGYNPDDTTRYPVVYWLHGATGNYLSDPGMKYILDTLIENNDISPVIVIKPDGSIGPWAGSCYTNSELYGNFEDYIVYDLVEFIDSAYKTIPEREKRAIWGGSMGGFGSMKLALKHPDIYCAVAAHSGPLDFSHWADWVPLILNENGGPPVDDYIPTPYTFTWLFYTLTGALSPDLDNPPYYVDFPLDPWGNFIDSVFNRWQLHNPVRLAENLPPNSDLAIYFDCGMQDELLIYPFNTGFADSLDLLGIDYTFESFNGTHTSESLKRMPIALIFLDRILLGRIYALRPCIDKTYARKNIDSVLFRTEFSDIYNHPFTPHLIYINKDNTLIDSLLLYDDGLHGDSLAYDGIYGAYIPPQQTENFFRLDVSTSDNQTGAYYKTSDLCRFTTAGPVKLDSVSIVEASGYYFVRPFVTNEGTGLTITSAKIRHMCNDPWVPLTDAVMDLPDLPPGESVGASGLFIQRYIDSLFPGYFNLEFEVMIDGWTYWKDNMVVGITENNTQVPLAFGLEQNYPNPFNPETKIKYSIQEPSRVTLKVYDILGREIAILINENKSSGTYELIWNAANLPSGVYLYQLRATPGGGQAGRYTAVKKMLLLK